MKYHQIINNIIEGWKRLLKKETALEQGIDWRKTNIDLISMKHNINKTLYSAQLKDTSQEKSKSEVKWTNDFQRCIIDMKLRNFQYKYLMRIVPKNKYLFKCKLAPTILYDFCAMQEETNAHLFHLMLLFFQSSGLCVQSPSIIPVPGYPLCLVPHLRSLDDRFSYLVV